MPINLEGESNLEIRVCLSLLTAKPLEINDIDGGIKSHHLSFLEMLNKISTGGSYNINKSGCRLRITPGTLMGGEFEHECDNEASLGYYALYLILLSPFCQKPIECTLNGVTNKNGSFSIERINYGLKDFVQEMVGPASIFSLHVKKRGAYPLGGGMALFSARPAQSLSPLNRTKVGKIQKIKGVSWTTRLNPTLGKRVIDGAKKNFKNYISDFYVHHNHSARDASGKSSGYGVSLVAITTEGATYTTEVTSKSRDEFDGEPSVPEDIGQEAIESIKRAIIRGGVVSSELEPIVLTMMALGKHNVSKVVIGVPGDDTCRAMRDLFTFTGVRFNMAPLRPGMEGYRENTRQELLLTCMGCGLVNLNRAIR